MRKPDPYETRARELALGAGVDPDSRLSGQGNDQCLHGAPIVTQR